MVSSEPFATPSDLVDRWRPLADSEENRAAVLLGDASRIIRREFLDIDQRIATGELDGQTAAMVACGMVQRALLGVAQAGVSSQTDVVGPFQRVQAFSNPLGDLYLTASDLRLLEPNLVGRRAFSIDLGANTPTYVPEPYLGPGPGPIW